MNQDNNSVPAQQQALGCAVSVMAVLAFFTCLFLCLTGCSSGSSSGVAFSTATPVIPVVDATRGLICDVYSILPADESGTVNWSTLLADGSLKFTTIVPNFEVANQSANGIFGTFTSAEQAMLGNTNYALDCYGYLQIPQTGSYLFQLGSDDGSELSVDGAKLINMPDMQSYTTQTATVTLLAGQHAVNVLYFQGPLNNIGLTLNWQGPKNTSLSTLAPITSALSH